jgi:enoyl-CoA hydratase/carnithine racemase
MVNRVVPDDELMPAALALAGELAAVSRPAMATTKQLFYAVTELAFADALALGREANKRMRAFRKGSA